MTMTRVREEHRWAARLDERQWITVRRSVFHPVWNWYCQVCGWTGQNLHSQQSALREGLQHLAEVSR